MKALASSVIVLALTAISATAIADDGATPAPTATATSRHHHHSTPPVDSAAAAAAPSAAPAPTVAPVASAAPPATVAPPPAASATPPPAPAEGTPIATRPAKALSLAAPIEPTGWGTKLIVGVGLAAAAGLYLLKKKKSAKAPKKRAYIEVVGKTSVGVRSELLVVDVEGTRLLVGMTPSAIQTLAVLQTPEDDEAPNAADEARESREMDDELEDERPVVIPAARAGAMMRQLTGARASKTPPEPMPFLEMSDRPRWNADSKEPPPRESRDSRPAFGGSATAVDKSLQIRQKKSSKVAMAAVDPSRMRRTNSSQAFRATRVAGQAKGLLLALEEPSPKSEL